MAGQTGNPSIPVGAQLNANQIAAGLLAAGFRDGQGYQGKGWTWAVATVLAESGGNGNAVNTNGDGTSDHGYFQWNTKWHPEGVAIAGQLLPEAQLALKVTNKGADWSQWSTFHNGQAAAQLGTAATATLTVAKLADSQGGFGAGFWDTVGGAAAGAAGAAAGAVAKATGLDGIAGAVGTIADAVTGAGKWISSGHNWLRILEVIAGLGLVVGAVALIKPELAGAMFGPEGAAIGAAADKAEHAKASPPAGE